MSADDSFSSSDESNLSSPLVQESSFNHRLICNHRLASTTQLEEGPSQQQQQEQIEDFVPLIDDTDCKPIKLKFPSIKQQKEEFWLTCRAFFAMTFLMVALLALFFLFYNHLFLTTTANANGNHNGSSSVKSKPTWQINLDGNNRYHLFWSVNYESRFVLFELKLKLTTNFDWFAFGFSDYGSLSKADLCIVWFDKKRILHFEDARTDNDTVVVLDHKSNDCQLIKSKQNRNEKLLYIAFRRYFDTCDPGDYQIDNGTTHLVYATGRGPISHVETLRLKTHSHGLQRVQLLKSLLSTPSDDVDDDDQSKLLPESIKTIEFRVDNVTVPNVETTYWCRLVNLPKNFQNKLHIVRYEATIPEQNRDLVHHMELFHCEVDVKLVLPEWNGNCHDANMPKPLHNCKRVVAAWAFGAGPMIYPDHVGLPVGGENYSLYLMIEVHYNNPELKSGSLDNSGIRIYYTEKLRSMDAGILEIGLEYTDKNSIPPNTVMEISGYCVSECTRVGLPENGITIFASQLHTHLTGVSTWTEHIRQGSYLGEINRDNHYSPHFQEIRKLWQPIRIYPGDALIHVCRYDTRQRNQITLGGFGISDEMCVNYLHYYPKTDLEVCKSSVDTEHLRNYFELMRVNENQNTSKDYTVADNYRNIKWTRSRIQTLDRLYHTAPLSVQCNRSSGLRFPGYWNGISLTTIHHHPNQRNSTPPFYQSNGRCRWVLRKKLLADEDDDDVFDEEEEGNETEQQQQQDEFEDWNYLSEKPISSATTNNNNNVEVDQNRHRQRQRKPWKTLEKPATGTESGQHSHSTTTMDRDDQMMMMMMTG